MTSEVLIPDPQQQVEHQQQVEQQQQQQQQQQVEQQQVEQEQQQQVEQQQQQQQQQVEQQVEQQHQQQLVEQQAQQPQQQQQQQQQPPPQRNVQVMAVAVVQRRGVLGYVLRGLIWPFGVVVRAYRGFCWVLGFRPPQQKVQLTPSSITPERHNVSGRKRVHGLTRMLLCVLPRWLQRVLGFRSYSSIGRCASPEIRESPTKPSGKGSKRKQDELDEEDSMEEGEEEEEEEEGHLTWVETLSQELGEDDGQETDPDYEPSTVETESEEYRSHNSTESDVEV